MTASMLMPPPSKQYQLGICALPFTCLSLSKLLSVVLWTSGRYSFYHNSFQVVSEKKDHGESMSVNSNSNLFLVVLCECVYYSLLN